MLVLFPVSLVLIFFCGRDSSSSLSREICGFSVSVILYAGLFG